MSISVIVILCTPSVSLSLGETRSLDNDYNIIPRSIVIYSDGYDPKLDSLSIKINQTIAGIYSNIKLRHIRSVSMFENVILKSGEIKIYVLKGGLSGILIGEQVYSWENFAKKLKLSKESYHIVGFGNTKEISNLFNNSMNVFIEGSEVIDAEFVYLYAIWKTADILSKSDSRGVITASKKLRARALIYYQNNAQDLYARIFEPVEPLGERNIDELKDQVKFKDNITLVSPIKDEEYANYNDLNLVMNIIPHRDKGGDSISTMDGDNFVSVMKLPEKSGLPGPLAPIVDKLLALLFDWLKDKTGSKSFDIGLSKSVVEEIVNFTEKIIGRIKSWINENIIDSLLLGIEGAGAIFTISYAIIQNYGLEESFWNLLEKGAVKLLEELSDKLNEQFSKIKELLTFDGEYSIPLGEISAFTLKYSLSLYPKFELKKKGFIEFINKTIFQGEIFSDPVNAFMMMLSPDFLTVMPVFEAKMELKSVASEKNSLFKYLLDTLGLKLTFSGGAHIELAILKIGENLDDITYFEVLSWSFKFSIQIKKSFTLLDFVTGGATSSGPMALIQEFLGLNRITLDVLFKISLEIIKKAVKAGKPSHSTFTLKITIGTAVNIDVLIVEFYGLLEATLKFFQDITANTPLEIFLILHLMIKVKINLLFLDVGGSWDWYPLSKDGYRLTPEPGTPDFKENAQGIDSDGDGLSDVFENNRSDLDSQNNDTDGDGLSDLEELSLTFTKPNVRDTDGDGLIDGDEFYKYSTDPLKMDTDRDSISDGEEVLIYSTNPLIIDTDGDGLSDPFEINYSYPLENVTPSVTEVIIGGVSYNDHTDPLNPDTDNDGLLDGEEWIFGEKYGDPSLFNATQAVGELIIFNNGFTHPLDNDTDDDSYEQLSDGTISPRNRFLYDMRDGVEVHGQWVMFINATTGDPEFKFITTNPCIPDSDGDTAPGSLFLISDGYELSLSPPSDPNDADTDDDGLIDGLEGINIENGNHTHYNNPDTDNDGLNDLLDTLLPTDPRDPDTDDDYLLDGDEYIKYGTSPYLNDTDFDGLTDGEELLFFYTNPKAMDSDLDGLNDGEEILIYNTDPMNPDTDWDGLDDFYELFISKTDPFNDDTDGDSLTDGEELTVYSTDPLKWDTDGDSIMQANEYGEITLNWGDNVEIQHGTNPTVSDTDGDGLTDGQEVYLNMGGPNFEPILVNPLDNDTDDDGLLDGQEVILQNISIITFPYSALVIVFPYGTDPLSNDTDSDGLNDYDEISVYGSNPLSNDSDGDTLPDYDEVYIHGTDPANNDTDGDDIPDNEELTNAIYYQNIGYYDPRSSLLGYYNPKYETSATNPDSDGDLLPDGEELYRGTDALNPDSDGDGVEDGYEFDEDLDGLSDGEEFFIYRTHYLAGGGFNSTDSDGDGISDGDEVNIYGTNCTNPDTDGDGFNDGVEIQMNTDPTEKTNATDVGEALKEGVSSKLFYGAIGAAFLFGIIFVPLVKMVYRLISRRRGEPKPEEGKGVKREKRSGKRKKKKGEKEG